MNKQISTNAKIVKNSLNDGHVKIKMATIGEVNDNGFLIKNNQSIKFPNKSYPLLFEHKHDLDSVIGTFKPIGIEGADMMADAQITNPKALELVKSDLDKILNEMGYLKIQDCKADDCNAIIQKIKDLASSRKGE